MLATKSKIMVSTAFVMSFMLGVVSGNTGNFTGQSAIAAFPIDDIYSNCSCDGNNGGTTGYRIAE